MKNICKYLHGEILLELIICNERPILFYKYEHGNTPEMELYPPYNDSKNGILN
jgi:hypothetical protein